MFATRVKASQHHTPYLEPLRVVPRIRADFVARIGGITLSTDKATVMAELMPLHEQRAKALMPGCTLHTAEQVHGNLISRATHTSPGRHHPGADGLITNAPGLMLCIHVADCAPIYLIDPRRCAIGLLHSGSKGTSLHILARGVEAMNTHFGTEASDLVAVCGPCIRPPYYEWDFAATIASQARELGLCHYEDCGLNTACNLEEFFSYRMERGATGRMAALLGIAAEEA